MLGFAGSAQPTGLRTNFPYLRLWVPSPLVAQAAGLCAAGPAAPPERDRVRGRPAVLEPWQPPILTFPRKGGRNLNVEHKVRKPSGAFKLRPMDLSAPAKGLIHQAPTNLAEPAQ